MRTILFLSMFFMSLGVFAQESNHIILSKELFEASIQTNSENLKRDIQLVDVRRPEEFEAGKIEGAVNMNVLEPETFKEQIETLDKSKPVYIYCRSGNRSGKAAMLMQELGFKAIYDLEGGYLNWTSSSETKATEKNHQ